ncbi:hypothetical protein [Nocardioides pelophilus]|uniref:hypothetical protein n=1 Tax=Nocardioides pelophilus TaxID=2172019 RepID=UPI0015FF12A1|nr:hypothetical protein [Nocardioides pelophilus]
MRIPALMLAAALAASLSGCGDDSPKTEVREVEVTSTVTATASSEESESEVNASTTSVSLEAPAYTCNRLFVNTSYLSDVIGFWNRSRVDMDEITKAEADVEGLVEIAASADPIIAEPLTVVTTETSAFLEAMLAPNFDGYPTPPFKSAAQDVTDVCDAVMDEVAESQWTFKAKDYGKYADVLVALHREGFDEYIELGKNPDATVGSTCRWISGEPPGGSAYRSERRSWHRALTEDSAEGWGWTDERADKFVDVVFEACLATGHSKGYVPTITNGVWTVGRDIPPGTYRSNGVGGSCYWAITRSGSNGQDIIANDLPSGGYPSVDLSVGQDFSTDGCGTWKKLS